MRILIAEDDQVLADGLLRTLRASGAAVDHVASGSEADAALMTNNEFDLLILDLGLPRLHGLEVLKRLRARGSAPPVKETLIGYVKEIGLGNLLALMQFGTLPADLTRRSMERFAESVMPDLKKAARETWGEVGF